MNPSAQDVRTTLQKKEPAFLALADALKPHGARLTALRVGRPGEPGGIDIGWDKWLAARAQAITWEGGAVGLEAGREEWKRIKAETLRTGEEARRKPTAGRRRAVG